MRATLVFEHTSPAMGFIASADEEQRRRSAVKSARRNSVFVRLSRVVLPIFGIAILGVFTASVMLQGPTQVGPVTIDSISIDDGALVMENPRMSGLDENNRAYALQASEASQRLDDTNTIDLKEIDATLAVDDNQDARIEASGGVFDQETEKLKLFDGVRVTSTSGVVAELEEADVDLNTGSVVSNRDVKIDMLNGTLNAAGMEIIDNGDVLRFTGPIRLLTKMQSE